MERTREEEHFGQKNHDMQGGERVCDIDNENRYCLMNRLGQWIEKRLGG